MRMRCRSSGFTLIEVMLALVVSSIAVLAAVRLHAHAGTVYLASQSERSLEESARLALATLRRDVELAGYFGFAQGSRIVSDADSPGPAVRGDCGANWAVQFTVPIGGGDNGYRWQCRAYRDAAEPGTDTLVLRYVDARRAQTLDAGRLYLESRAEGTGTVFVAHRGTAATNDLLVSVNAVRTLGYYVSTVSAGSEGIRSVPSLRIKRLSADRHGPRVMDEEIQPGVEDLQIQLGIDADVPEAPGYGSIDRFVATAELNPGERVVSVRIWLLVRSLWREQGLPAETIPAYANRAARTVDDGYRRRLVTTTIAIDASHPQ